MAYDVSTVTALGATLLASATAADKLILVGCDATTEVLTQQQAVAVTSRPATPYSTTSRIFVEGAADNHVYVRALFVAGESTGGDANTLYLYGHSESDPNTTIVLAVLSSATAFHLPVTGDVANTYGVLFDVIYTVASGAVETINSSAYATYAEFKRLKDRTVTTYKEGETTQGDNQTIRGNKVFKDFCTFEDGCKTYDVLMREDPNNTGCDIKTHSFFSSGWLGFTSGYCDTSQSLDDLSAWPVCVQVKSEGKPDYSQGILPNCAIRLSTRDIFNAETCYLCVANDGTDELIDLHIAKNLGGGETGDSRLYLEGDAINLTYALKDLNNSNLFKSNMYLTDRSLYLTLKQKDTVYDKGASILFNAGEVTHNDLTKKVGSILIFADGYNGRCGIDVASIDNPTSQVRIFSGEASFKVSDDLCELNCDNEIRLIGDDVNSYADDTLISSENSAEIRSGNTTNGTVYSRIYEEPESTIITTYGITGGLGDAQLEVQNVSNTPVIINKCGNVQTHTIKFQDNSMCYWGLESSSNPVRIIFEKSNNKGVFYPKNESPYVSCDIGKSTNKFDNVYANKYYGNVQGFLNGVNDYFETAEFVAQGNYATGFELNSYVSASPNKKYLDLRNVVQNIIAGFSNNYDGSDSTLLGIGSVQLAAFVLTAGLSSDVYFNPGTVFSTNGTPTTSNPAYYGILTEFALNGTGGSSTSWVPTFTNFATTNQLKGDWVLLNSLSLKSGAQSGGWAVVLVVKVGMEIS